MKGLPKRLETATDITNCFSHVQAGDIAASDLLLEMEALEAQRFIRCAIKNIASGQKVVTVNYCAEATVGEKAVVGDKSVDITAVEHFMGEDENFETTEITLASKIPTSSTEIDIPSGYDVYAYIGMPKTEFDAIKAQLV